MLSQNYFARSTGYMLRCIVYHHSDKAQYKVCSKLSKNIARHNPLYTNLSAEKFHTDRTENQA